MSFNQNTGDYYVTNVELEVKLEEMEAYLSGGIGGVRSAITKLRETVDAQARVAKADIILITAAVLYALRQERHIQDHETMDCIGEAQDAVKAISESEYWRATNDRPRTA